MGTRATLTGPAPNPTKGAQMLPVFLPGRFLFEFSEGGERRSRRGWRGYPHRFTNEFSLKSIPADPQAFSADQLYDRHL